MNNKSNVILIAATLIVILLGLAVAIGNKYQRSVIQKALSMSSTSQFSTVP